MRGKIHPSLRKFMPAFGTGEAPGTAIYTGVEKHFEIRIHIFDWTKTEINENSNASIADAVNVRNRQTVSWIDVSGIHDTDLIRQIGQRFDLHSLTIEDILNPHHLPKIEHYPEYVYIVLKMAYLIDDGETKLEQISLILGTNFVLTFQEESKDVFDGLRKRIRDGFGQVRQRGHDYLAYALMDAVVDNSQVAFTAKNVN